MVSLLFHDLSDFLDLPVSCRQLEQDFKAISAGSMHHMYAELRPSVKQPIVEILAGHDTAAAARTTRDFDPTNIHAELRSNLAGDQPSYFPTLGR